MQAKTCEACNPEQQHTEERRAAQSITTWSTTPKPFSFLLLFGVGTERVVVGMTFAINPMPAELLPNAYDEAPTESHTGLLLRAFEGNLACSADTGRHIYVGARRMNTRIVSRKSIRHAAPGLRSQTSWETENRTQKAAPEVVAF